MEVPPLDITPKTPPEVWAERLQGTVINNVSIRREFDGDLTQLDAFADGNWWVQDAAAALPAALLEQLASVEASSPELLQFFSSTFLTLSDRLLEATGSARR